MDGLIYLLNQSGLALADANQRLAALTEENNKLRTQAQTCPQCSE